MCGAYSEEKTDYPNIAKEVAKEVQKNEENKGILICGTGYGMCITANKYKKIRCVPCYSTETAKMAKMHNNVNILALGADQNTKEEALAIIETWIQTEFEGGRHQKRLQMIEEIEKTNMK